MVGQERLHVRRELMLVAMGFVAYFGVRAVTQGSRAEAVAHARDFVSLERWLHLYHEPALQSAIAEHRSLVTLVNWIYIWGHWPAILAVAVWLFLRAPDGYRLIRNAFFVSGAIGMLFFVGFPVAPPRLVHGLGFADTVAQYSHAYRALQPPSLVNRFAAFPSLHVGWDLLVGIALVRYASRPAARLAGVAMPVLMATAVVLTGNHWLIDVAGGVVVSLVGLAVALRVTRPGGHAQIPSTVSPISGRYDHRHARSRPHPARAPRVRAAGAGAPGRERPGGAPRR
jgi:membrane-associated phospholipid phosphatase